MATRARSGSTIGYVVLALIGSIGWSIYAAGADPPRWPADYFARTEAEWRSGRYSVNAAFFGSLTLLLAIACVPLVIRPVVRALTGTGVWRSMPAGPEWRSLLAGPGSKRLRTTLLGAVLVALGLSTLYAAVFEPSILRPLGFFGSALLVVAPSVVGIGVWILLGSALPERVLVGPITTLRKTPSETVPEFFATIDDTELQVPGSLFPLLREKLVVAVQVSVVSNWVTVARAFEGEFKG
jgi:hypothetical protein